VLLVSGAGDYLPARLAPEDRRPGVAHPEDPELLDCRPRPAWPAFFQDYYLLDVPAAAPGVADLRLRLQPDHPLPLRLEFADGKPCDLTMVGGQGDRRVSGQGLPAGTPAVIRGLARGENHWAFLLTTDDRLGGAVRVEGGAPGPIPVRLQPTGEITGRLLNAQGQPQADAGFQVVYRDGPDRAGVILARRLGMRKPTPAEVNRHRLTYGYPADGTEHVHGPEKTDAQGRFRIAGLIPDASFDLVAIVISATDAQGQRRIQGTAKVATATLKPGAALDLGDLQVSGPLEK
jgi:hypothetical protein